MKKNKQNYHLIIIKYPQIRVLFLLLFSLQVDYADNNDIIVYFTLFDRPPPIGDVASPAQEPDLPTVRTRLTNFINNGNLKITFNVPNAQVYLIIKDVEHLNLR